MKYVFEKNNIYENIFFIGIYQKLVVHFKLDKKKRF